jgi:hypothetical protein
MFCCSIPGPSNVRIFLSLGEEKLFYINTDADYSLDGDGEMSASSSADKLAIPTQNVHPIKLSSSDTGICCFYAVCTSSALSLSHWQLGD